MKDRKKRIKIIQYLQAACLVNQRKHCFSPIRNETNVNTAKCVFPPFALATCFPALCASHVAGFAASRTGCLFSRPWYLSDVLASSSYWFLAQLSVYCDWPEVTALV